jgi:hypothetical protein
MFPKRNFYLDVLETDLIILARPLFVIVKENVNEIWTGSGYYSQITDNRRSSPFGKSVNHSQCMQLDFLNVFKPFEIFTVFKLEIFFSRLIEK